MAKSLPARPDGSDPAPIGPYALVVSSYNSEFTAPLANAAIQELLAINPAIQTETFHVPGSFEIPVMANHVAATRRFRAILAMGVIFEGETAHAQLIAASVSDALQRIAIESGIPVIHEILLLKNDTQARARCIDSQLNRGIEAARAAIRITNAIAHLSPHS